MKTRSFQATCEVTREASLLARINLFQYARETLAAQLSSDLRGPRGGRYVPVGDVEFFGESQDYGAFIRNVTVFGARRQGRYVRPLQCR